MKKIISLLLVFIMILAAVPSLANDLTADVIKENAEYLNTYDDCTVAVYDNVVWAWGEAYGETPVKLLDDIETLKTISMSTSKSYYAICADKSLYVWGEHGFYVNVMPASKPSKYTYVGGMLGLPCNYNVAPQYAGPPGSIDYSKYEEKTPDQKVPVKLLDGVKEVIIGHGEVFALCEDGAVYVWGQGSNSAYGKDYTPKLINLNAEKIYITGTSPALNTDKTVILEKDGSLTIFDGDYNHGSKEFYNVAEVYTKMYLGSFSPVILVLTYDGKLYEQSYYHDNDMLLDGVVGVKSDGMSIYIKSFDGTVYEREYGVKAETKIANEEIEFDIKNISVFINGEKLVTDTKPYIKNGRTTVPMRAIFEALGASVTWDDEAKTAIGVRDSLEVKITIGENVLYKNGEAIALDVAAEITNDRTMVPVRAISEAFGCEVNWNNEIKTVEITN